MADRLSLTDREWKEFKVGELFELKVARSNDKGKLKRGDIPFIGRSNDNNGLQGYYDADKVTDGNCITLGMVGTFRAFWQDKDFAASQNILTLRSYGLNRYTGLFICSVIETAIDGKYSYGNSIKAGTFGDTVIKLPSKDGQPDYDFMECYIKQLYDGFMDSVCVYTEPAVKDSNKLHLTDREWKEFKVGELFKIEQGKGKINKDIINGEKDGLPIATASTVNNGILDWSKDQAAKIRCKNTITIGRQTGIAFYQPYDYYETDNILVLSNGDMDVASGLFMVAIYNQSSAGKFSYGRVASIGKIKDEVLSLPVTPSGEPDYDFMERYIKQLPFSKGCEL